MQDLSDQPLVQRVLVLEAQVAELIAQLREHRERCELHKLQEELQKVPPGVKRPLNDG